MVNKLILIGGGGHCKSCIEVIESIAGWEIAGVLDSNPNIKLPGLKLLGDDSMMEKLARDNYRFLITVGFIESPSIRIKLFEKLASFNAVLPVVVASSAHTSKYASIGKGTIVMHRAFINAMSKVGQNCVINTGALVEHDCLIGDHTHISTQTVVNGYCRIGNRVFVGSNTVINNGIEVADDIIIGSGSVVNRSLQERGIYAGNPASRIR